MTIRHVFAAVVLSCLGAGAQAQQAPARQPTPEEMQKIMDATMGAMVGVMGPMTNAVLEAQLNSAAKPESAERVATFKKNLYDALLKKGFKADDALQIVVATGVPAATPSTN